MPLIQTSDLPSFSRLKAEGQPVLDSKRAESQDIRELHIGIVNMMPDGAFEATERQFLRLLGNSAQIAQIHVHFITIKALERNADIQNHINLFYEDFQELRGEGLDALIITGANITSSDMSREPYWRELTEIFDWAEHNVSSVICACLASHAALKYFYNLDKTLLPEKLWGLYPHEKKDRAHPLMSWVNTAFQVPHSRHNDVSARKFTQAGCHILVESSHAGVHIATSPDRFRFIFVQGHLEYDTHSLLKEYKREIRRFVSDQRSSYPPVPENYLTAQSLAILNEYKQKLLKSSERGMPAPDFPEGLIQSRLYNTWRDSAKSMMNNWIGLVYQTTHYDRKKQYMDTITRDNPLGL